MMGKRIAGLLAGLSLMAAAAAPGAHAATGGIQLGPTLLFPVVTASATYDDNVYLSSFDAQDDWYFSVAPSLRLLVPIQRFYIEAEGGLDFIEYQDIDGEDSTNWFVGAAAGAEFPGGLSFKISDREEYEWLVSSQEYGPGEDSWLNTLKGMVGYTINDRFRVELAGTRDDYAYDLSEDRERVEGTVLGTFFWKFQPRTSALAEVGYTDITYDSNDWQDSTETRFLLGVAWDVTSRTTGFAKGGYEWKRYDTEDLARGVEDGEYFTASVGSRHTFSSRTSAEFRLNYSSEESDFLDNPYYLRTEIAAGLSQRFTTKVYGRAAARWYNDEYPNETTYDNPYDPERGAETGKRTDQTFEGSVLLGFDVLRWLALEAEAAYETRDSEFGTFDYDATRVTLSAKAAF